MTTAERYAQLADAFGARVHGVPLGDWDRPAPCEGWVARDVVRHLVTWVPGMFADVLALPPHPAVDVDPAGAWDALDGAIRGVLADPERAGATLTNQAGTFAVEEAVAMFVAGDLLIHTWDLARATGQDERLDPDEVHGMLVGLEPMDEVLRSSGHYGPRVEVAADSDEQTRLIAFTGRRP